MEESHGIGVPSMTLRRTCLGMGLVLGLMACDSRPPAPQEHVWGAQTEALERAQNVEQQLRQAEKRTRATSELDASPPAPAAE